MHRKKLQQYIHNIKGNIRVYCRVKPCADESIIKFPEWSRDLLNNEIFTIELKSFKAQSNENLIFNFDKVFTEKSTQEDVNNLFKYSLDFPRS
jgi:hypothetical protein